MDQTYLCLRSAIKVSKKKKREDFHYKVDFASEISFVV